MPDGVVAFASPPRMRLVDSHCHLQSDRFARDADQVIGAARLAGVERILIPGWDVASSERGLAIAASFPGLDVAVGVHPHAAAEVDDGGWARIMELAADPRVVAIGETGLDLDRAFAPLAAQLGNLRRNLVLALAVSKPAILHCRSRSGDRTAQDALLAELRSAGFAGASGRAIFGGRPPAILHSFSGPVDYAEAALDMGLAISFSGLVFRAGEEASAVVARLVPDDRLLVETDAPYLSPPGGPRGRNEPSAVAITARWLAEQRAEDPEALGDRLVANYGQVLGG